VAQAQMQSDTLEVIGLVTHFETQRGVVRAVDDVSLRIPAGSTLALVGESGSGKSITGLSIMRLVPPPGRILSGQVFLNGRNLLDLPDDEMRTLRGREVAMIFQDPMTSLNPVYKVGHQIAEVVMTHEGLHRKPALAKAIAMMDRVRIPDAARRAGDYPHQLSGGMRQRVMIAMALCCNPKLLIADEPTTALDVTIQAEILELLAKLKDEFQISMLLITHDLGIVAETADRVAVMYAGQIVEQGPVEAVFRRPAHPYTQGLLNSIPRISQTGATPRRLATIEGSVPSLINLGQGCRFASRCSYQAAECVAGDIELLVRAGRLARCIRPVSDSTG
jgi:oligopeptide/dipeptide ABC transporter ATP-binding protein